MTPSIVAAFQNQVTTNFQKLKFIEIIEANLTLNLIRRQDIVKELIDEALETLEMNGGTCDILNCVCNGQNPVCEHQEWLNDPDRIGDSDEENGSDDETDAEESDTDQEMLSDESGYDDEVGIFISYRDHD